MVYRCMNERVREELRGSIGSNRQLFVSQEIVSHTWSLDTACVEHNHSEGKGHTTSCEQKQRPFFPVREQCVREREGQVSIRSLS